LARLYGKNRRWNIIVSGLLIGTLAVIVTFTDRAAFLSPTAVVVVAAIGLAAVLLQLRFRDPQLPDIYVPNWLNILAIIFAMVAFFGDLLRIRPPISELIALLAIGCFAISGGMVMHALRKRSGNPKRES
jgi:drug/metabolite transporter (DMT)-like permease